MKTTITIFQIILAISLITLIFLQSSGDTDGRSNLLSATVPQKRGWEKIIFYFSIIVLVLFVAVSVIQTIS
ncbi:preprotein translocase subunit SecG [Candidatus Shapirobacteria bacterium]|nr:preprotein translocase subunit SecG [Candidatus Shapirobacteria bacterium]